jgi:hypothetical protein
MLVICSVTLLLAWAQKSPCANARWAHHRQYSQFCYSDILPLWGTERLDLGAVPYRDQAVEYPVLTGGFLWMSAEIARAAAAFEGTHDTIVVFGVVSVVLLALLDWPRCGFTAGAAEPRRGTPRSSRPVRYSFFHAFTNWDLARDDPDCRSTLGLGSTKTRRRRRPHRPGRGGQAVPDAVAVADLGVGRADPPLPPAAWCTVAAAFAWLAVNLPVAAGYYPGWKDSTSSAPTARPRPARSGRWRTI